MHDEHIAFSPGQFKMTNASIKTKVISSHATHLGILHLLAKDRAVILQSIIIVLDHSHALTLRLSIGVTRMTSEKGSRKMPPNTDNPRLYLTLPETLRRSHMLAWTSKRYRSIKKPVPCTGNRWCMILWQAKIRYISDSLLVHRIERRSSPAQGS